MGTTAASSPLISFRTLCPVDVNDQSFNDDSGLLNFQALDANRTRDEETNVIAQTNKIQKRDSTRVNSRREKRESRILGIKEAREVSGKSLRLVSESTIIIPTFQEIRNQEDPNGLKHDLRLTCSACGTTRSCKCSKPKRAFYGLCENCSSSRLNK